MHLDRMDDQHFHLAFVRHMLAPMLQPSSATWKPGIGSGQRALLLFDDCAIRHDPRFVNECLAHNIDIIYLAPNTTHHMQPQDISFNWALRHHCHMLLNALKFHKTPSYKPPEDKFSL